MLNEISTDSDVLDLYAAAQTVLSYSWTGSNPGLFRVVLVVGSEDYPIAGGGGDFQITITVGGNTIQPGPQSTIFSSATYSHWESDFFTVGAGDAVVVKLQSESSSDTSVEVAATLYGVDVSGLGTFTTPGTGVTDLVNYSIAIQGSVAKADNDYIADYDAEASFSDSSPYLRWMQLLYPIARDYVQRRLQPPECLIYAATGDAVTGDDIETNTDWTYVYEKPTSCLVFLGVVDAAQHNEITGADVYRPYAELATQIACDYEDDDVYFKYIKRLDDVSLFSPELVKATAHYLAYLGARPAGIDQQGQAEIKRQFHEAFNDARGMKGQRVYRRTPELTVDNCHYSRSKTTQVIRDDNGIIRLI